MTVRYTDKVASRGGFGSFWKLLMKWRGSVYKMVWQDMLVFVVLYYLISLIYRFGLPSESKRAFESLVLHCARFRNLIPVSFVLGFYVSLVVSRWWGIYQSLPWPDTAAILATTHIRGECGEAKEARRTILRYINLTIALTFAMISPVVKRKLPTMNSFISAGYATEEDINILTSLESKSDMHKTWVPVLWACRTADQARRDGLVSDAGQRAITNEILKIRGNCGSLMGWNDYNIPLVYTQVVTIAVYSFFFFSLLGEQFLDPNQGYASHTIDLYVPLFALLQLFFYIGWIKVAEALLNPFGADDNDFEFVPLLERHVTMTRMLSEPGPHEMPLKIQDLPHEPHPAKATADHVIDDIDDSSGSAEP